MSPQVTCDEVGGAAPGALGLTQSRDWENCEGGGGGGVGGGLVGSAVIITWSL